MKYSGKIRYKKKTNKFAGTVMFLLIFLLSISTIITIQLRAEKRNKDVTKSTSTSSEVIEDVTITPNESIETIESSDSQNHLSSIKLQPEQTEQALTFILPFKGNIIKEYSPENLIYSKTMCDWRQHMGTDIICDYECEISAMSDGVISDIRNDTEFGTTVTIEHQNGVVTAYSNIQIDNNIAVGKQVKSGDVIGSVINNPPSETEDELHIHIEASKDSVSIDPISLIK